MERVYVEPGRWLSPDAADAYNRMRHDGMPAGITSAGRTEAEQRAMYNAWVAGGKKHPPSVAKPGTSKHEGGNAIDLPKAAADWAHKNGSKYGFTNPSWAKRKETLEPWHFEFEKVKPAPKPKPKPTTPKDVTVNAKLPRLDLSDPKKTVTGAGVGILQGLLLAAGYGPAGLVGKSGKPDRKAGPLTRAALGRFQTKTKTGTKSGKPDYIVGAATWAALLGQ